MGCFNEYCPICGMDCHPDQDYMEAIDCAEDLPERQKTYLRELSKWKGWMRKCVILSSTGEVYPGCIEVNCNTSYKDQELNNHTTEPNSVLGILRGNIKSFGVFMHEVCYTILCSHFKHEVTYADLPVLDEDGVHLVLDPRLCSKNDYQWQDTEFTKMFKDKKMYYCAPPMLELPRESGVLSEAILRLQADSKKNYGRILRHIKHFKIRPGRPSPNISATYFQSGARKFHNSSMWEVRAGAWRKVPESDSPLVKATLAVKIYKSEAPEFKQKAFISELFKIPSAGDALSATTPFFITSAETGRLVIVGDPNGIDKFVKKWPVFLKPLLNAKK
jgi:hypothetical protein